MRRDLSSDLPKVLADANQLEQVFLNLISNAKDAIDPKGGGAVTIISRQSEKADFVEVLVLDTGIGMDSTTISDIFNPFFTTKDVGKGTGLGLSVSVQIVREAGGMLTAKNNPGGGATLRVSLPEPTESQVKSEE